MYACFVPNTIESRVEAASFSMAPSVAINSIVRGVARCPRGGDKFAIFVTSSSGPNSWPLQIA